MGLLKSLASGVGGFVGGLAGDVIGAGINYNIAKENLASQEKWNERNLEFQKAGFEWQKSEANLTREREDTAIQRRTTDLQAAGLNPLLAAGSPASASTPITAPVVPHGEAPQNKFKMGSFSVLDGVQVAQALRLGAANISRTEAENLLLKERAREQSANADLAELDRDIAKSDYMDGSAPGRSTLRGTDAFYRTRLIDSETLKAFQDTATSYAREKNIDAMTANSKLDNAIRSRDFEMLKEFGIMDKSGAIAQRWADLLSLKDNIPSQVGKNLELIKDALGSAWNKLFDNK